MTKAIGAPTGITHGKASVSFQIVELARDLREHESMSSKLILRELRERYTLDISIDTLHDWLYYRTRVYG